MLQDFLVFGKFAEMVIKVLAIYKSSWQSLVSHFHRCDKSSADEQNWRQRFSQCKRTVSVLPNVDTKRPLCRLVLPTREKLFRFQCMIYYFSRRLDIDLFDTNGWLNVFVLVRIFKMAVRAERGKRLGEFKETRRKQAKKFKSLFVFAIVCYSCLKLQLSAQSF